MEIFFTSFIGFLYVTDAIGMLSVVFKQCVASEFGFVSMFFVSN